jgi:hypothetical protein
MLGQDRLRRRAHVGLMKKAAKGTLAVSTLGASVAAEKAIRAGSGMISAKGADVSEDDAAAGAIFVGMSHESGRNAKVTLYRDRIERVKERSRVSMNSARQDTEVTAIKSVTSIQAKKDGMVFTKVAVYGSANDIEFRFRHEDARKFKDAIMRLILEGPATTVTVETPAMPDVAEQLKKLAELRDAGVITADDFEAKKAELLARM